MNIPFDIIRDAHNRDIMILKSFDYIFDVKGARFHFGNLYNGDKYLSKSQDAFSWFEYYIIWFLIILIEYIYLKYIDKHLILYFIAGDNMYRKMNQNWKYLTLKFGKHLFDPITKKVFGSFRNYVQSGPLGTVNL